ncbi:MAG: lipocalin family protein [Prevotella sp.]|nr:lipocalin family protein [Prevotella sp.]
MKKLIPFIFLIFAFSAISCSSNKTKQNKTLTNDSISSTTKFEGDSTLYGLACEGCTDSVLIFLSFDGGDPITYDIIDAVQKHRILGRMTTGDWIAVVLNPNDSTVADEVINLDQLKGNWVYQAMPVLRNGIKKELNSKNIDENVDSIIQSSMKPNEQGFALKRNNVAEPIGKKYSNQDNSPVVYPEIKNYTEWRIYNGALILSQKQVVRQDKKISTVLENDTAEITFLRKDSLRLKFKNGTQGYYRKD